MQFSATQIDRCGLDQFAVSSLWTLNAQDAAILGLEGVFWISFAFHGPRHVSPNWEMVLGLSLLNVELYKGIPCYKTNTQS